MIRLVGMRRFFLLVPVLACALVLAACGGEDESAPGPETATGNTTQTAERPSGNPAAGKAVFAKAGCGGCHTLKAAGSTGTVGPRLDEAQPGLSLIIDRVTNGRNVMPPFKGQLSEQEITEVAAFVFESTANTAERPSGNAVAGKAVFVRSGCAGCHTLKAAGSTGTIGPKLDEAKPGLSLIIDRVTNGRKAMPPFRLRLSEREIADVAAFVFASTR
jgi:cbb3-type cytochrome c oxidase subunit III